MKTVRTTEIINGRSYVIEVRAVTRDRWRAELAGRGTTTALMPFYGSTAEEAADRLSRWLIRANRLASPPPVTAG